MQNIERGFVAGVQRYWNDRSVYAPFVCIILFSLFFWLSGALYITFGPNADTDKQVTLYGHFLPHPSISTPYKFITNERRIVTLNCRPRMKKSYCVYWGGVQDNEVALSYAPYKKSYINNVDGLVTSIRSDNTVIFSNNILRDSRDNRETSFMLKYWTERPFLIIAAFAPVSVFLFIVYGLFVSVRRVYINKFRKDI